MRFSSRLALAALAASLAAGSAMAQTATDAPVIGRKVADGVGYPTVIRLRSQPRAGDNGRLLLTFERDGMGGTPLYESLDDGATWAALPNAVDLAHHQDPNWQLRWQPNLLELDRPSGALAKGALILSANATRNDARGWVVEENLQVYVSTDLGRTWRYRGDIVDGGGHPEDHDNHGVWEPNLHVLNDGRLVAYYSSEQHKDQGFNQLLAHKVSSDGGATWGPEVIDVAAPGGVERPGMAVVEPLPTGGYVMSYEDIDGPKNGQVYVKFSRDGLDWGDPADRGTPVETASGFYPAASPIVRWFPLGGGPGVLAVVAERAGGGGDEGGRKIYWNNNLGVGPWWETPAPVQKATANIHAGWTQSLLLKNDGRTLLHLTTSSTASGRAEDNVVLAAEGGLDIHRYEAEDAVLANAVVIYDPHMSNGARVRVAARPGGMVRFEVAAHQAGQASVSLCYADVNRPATPRVSVNGEALPATAATAGGPHECRRMSLAATLRLGTNIVTVAGADQPFDLDYLQIDPLAEGR